MLALNSNISTRHNYMDTLLEHYTLYLGETSSALRGRVDVGRLRGGGWRQALSGFVRGGDDANRLAPRLLDRHGNLRCHMIGGRDRGWVPAPYRVRGRLCAGTTVLGACGSFCSSDGCAKERTRARR